MQARLHGYSQLCESVFATRSVANACESIRAFGRAHPKVQRDHRYERIGAVRCVEMMATIFANPRRIRRFPTAPTAFRCMDEVNVYAPSLRSPSGIAARQRAHAKAHSDRGILTTLGASSSSFARVSPQTDVEAEVRSALLAPHYSRHASAEKTSRDFISAS